MPTTTIPEKNLHDSLRREKRDTARSYAVLAVKYGANTSFSLLANKGRVVVFDTPAIAKEFVRRLGQGRRTYWKRDEETAFWRPYLLDAFNEASVIVDYDPYELPPNSPVPQESMLRSWQHHILWNILWDSQFVSQNRDGKLIHEATGEVEAETEATEVFAGVEEE